MSKLRNSISKGVVTVNEGLCQHLGYPRQKLCQHIRLTDLVMYLDSITVAPGLVSDAAPSTSTKLNRRQRKHRADKKFAKSLAKAKVVRAKHTNKSKVRAWRVAGGGARVS